MRDAGGPDDVPRARAAPAALDDWNLLRSFIAVHECGTLTEAARRLGVTQPSIGRHVRELEAALGETLFLRLPGRLKPTARGDELYGVVSSMKVAALEGARLFADAGEALGGTVRIAVSEVYATHVVAPLAARLLAEQPGLEIELAVSNRADNLLRRDADIAVRFFRPEQDDVVAVLVGRTEVGLYAHETYLARHGEPDGYQIPPEAFVAGFDREPMSVGPFFKGEPPPASVRFRFRTDAYLARQAAVESGWGLGAYLVDIAARKPGLRRVLADRFGMPQEVWLCAHPELRRSASMRFVWSRLEETLRSWLGGP